MPLIRPARYADIAPVAERMRIQDQAEVAAAGGLSPLEALQFSFQHSRRVYCLEHNGVPFAMSGFTDIAPGVGSPWVLGTDDYFKHRYFALAITHLYIRMAHQRYHTLMNYTDCRNHAAHKYLRLLGFKFTAFEPEYGVGRLPFLQFIKVA